MDVRSRQTLQCWPYHQHQLLVVVNNCDGTSMLTASGFTNYQWFNGARTVVIANGPAFISVNTSATYSVRSANNATGCVSSFTFVNAAPNVSPSVPASGGNQSRCGNGNVTLSATTGIGEVIDWYSAATGGTLLQSSSNTYTVSATTTVYAEARNTTNGCVSTTRTAITSTIHSVVTPSFTQVAAICSGAVLSALPTISTNGITGEWSPTLNNTATTTYTFTPSAGICASATTMTITVNPLPPATITPGSATTFCAGGSVVLTASAGSSYLWSNNATTQSITVSAGGDYSVTVTNENNCSATSAVTTVTVNELPTAVITVDGSTTVCPGSAVILHANADIAYTYQWLKDGEIIIGASSAVYAATATGNYTLIITNRDGCVSGASSPVTVTVEDVTAPVPDAEKLEIIMVECISPQVTVPTATDNCAGTIYGTTTDPLSYSTQGTHIIHWVFDDGHHNITRQDQVVIIRDVTPPCHYLSVKYHNNCSERSRSGGNLCSTCCCRQLRCYNGCTYSRIGKRVNLPDRNNNRNLYCNRYCRINSELFI